MCQLFCFAQNMYCWLMISTCQPLLVCSKFDMSALMLPPEFPCASMFTSVGLQSDTRMPGSNRYTVTSKAKCHLLHDGHHTCLAKDSTTYGRRPDCSSAVAVVLIGIQATALIVRPCQLSGQRRVVLSTFTFEHALLSRASCCDCQESSLPPRCVWLIFRACVTPAGTGL